MSTPEGDTPAPENNHHVRYTNHAGRDGTLLVERGSGRRQRALLHAAGIVAGGGTVHEIVEVTPQGPQVVEEPLPTLSPHQRLGADVAAAMGTDLGDAWIAEPDPRDPYRCTLRGPDGLVMAVYVGGPAYQPPRITNRLRVHLEPGDLAEYRVGDRPWPRMGASLDKSPALLANDIKRRVIVPARPMLAAARQERARREDHRAYLDRVTEQVARTVGVDRDRNWPHEVRVGEPGTPVTASMDLAYGPAGLARVELTVPVQAVPKVAELLAELLAEQPDPA